MIHKKNVFIFLFISAVTFTKAQQFNSDNYVTMPKGTGTFVLNYGERDASLYMVFALFKNFELNIQTNLFKENKSNTVPNHFTTNIYGKYTFWKNKKDNGGAAVFLGMGRSPGYYTQNEYSEMHKNYWTSVPVTIPIGNAVFWDIMPGALVDFGFEDGGEKSTAFGFTYSSRVAIYKIIPKTAIVGEIYGTEGKAYSKPEYKAGLRWEPNSWICVAGTYGAQLNGKKGAGFELGVVIYTPQFLKKDFIKNNSVTF